MKRKFLLSLLFVASLFTWQSVNAVTVTSSMSAYQFDKPSDGNWELSNIIDGNYSTLFWSNAAQKTGDYILLDYGSESPVCSIKLYFSRNASGNLWDAPTGNVKVQTSVDASVWDDIATFSSADIGSAATNNVYICDAGGTVARYVRLYLVSASGTPWLRLNEVETETGCVKEPRTVTVESASSAMGDVYIGEPGTKSVTKAGTVTVTATVNSGYMFVNWTNKADNSVLSTSAIYSYGLADAIDMVANFARDPKIDRTGWTATADSQSSSGADGPASYAIDGNNATWWHSQYNPTITEYPHWIMFDLGKSQSFTSFNYVSRGGTTSMNGNIAQYELYVSDNEADVKGYLESAKVNSGTFSYNGNSAPQEHKVDVDVPARGRYVLLKAVSAANSGKFAACAEFYLYLDAFVVSVKSADEYMGDVYIDTKGNKTKELSTDGDETATITAEPTEGYHFVSWSYNGAEVSTDAVYTTDLVTESREYVANFAFTPVTPRQVTAVSSDNSKGSVAIISPETEETSINTGDIVVVEATPANSDNFFVNWTDADNNVVSTESIYKYDKAPAITMTANFVTKYVITANQAEGGTMTVKDGDRTITTGDRVADGSVITITISTSISKGLEQLFINGVDVYAEDQNVYTTTETKATYTTTVTKATTIVPVYGDPKCRLYYSYEGAGYIEVWSSDTYDDGNPDVLAQPDGDQYSYGILLPFNENIYVFAVPYGDGELQSLTINGEDKYTPGDPETDLLKYGDIQQGADGGPINIKAVFTGISTGVENSVSESAGVRVYGVSGGIVINSESSVTAEIFTAGGELVATPSVSGNSTVSMASGFYIVRVNGASYKVSVK